MLLVLATFASAHRTAPNESGIEGTILISPGHGGPIRPGEPNAKPLPNMEFVVRSGDTDVRSFITDTAGRFRIVVPPGHYTVERKNRRKLGSCGPFDAEVVAGGMTSVNLDV